MAFLRLALFMRCRQKLRRATADGWHSLERRFNWRLHVESNELSLCDAIVAQALPDLETVIVSWVSVEIAAMTIHVRNGVHFDQEIDEVTFFFVGPLVNLHEDAMPREVKMQDLQVLTQLSVRLQDLAMCVEGDCENSFKIVVAWERRQDWTSIQQHRC